MTRFSIRDLFWGTLAVALVLGWWLHCSNIDANRQAVAQHAQKLKDALSTAKGLCEQLEDDLKYSRSASRRGPIPDLEQLRDIYEVGWTLLDEPIP